MPAIHPPLKSGGLLAILINVLYVFPSATKHIVDRVHDLIAKAYSNMKLGELRKVDELEMRGELKLVAYREYGEMAAERLEEIPDPKIALVILPHRSDLKFDFIKGKVERRERFLQFMTAKTASLLVRSAMDGFGRAVVRNLAAQIYLKASPVEDRVLWILERPAGGAESGTIYAGYDISRKIKREYKKGRFIGQRSEAAIRASLCDPRGKVIKMSTIPAPQGESLNEGVIIDMILNLQGEAQRSLGSEPSRLVLLKDGEVRYRDREIVKAAVLRVREEKPELRFELYSVIKRGKERLYLEKGNPQVGTYLLLNELEGLLVSSDLTLLRDRRTKEELVHANPVLVRRELVIPSGSAPPMIRFLNEFFDLTRLHWHSITHKMKTALPLKIVQEMGHYAIKNILIPEHVPYLPL